jgi:hypothetical protein
MSNNIVADGNMSTTNITYFSIEYWLEKAGSTMLTDLINLLSTPISFVGFILNLISLKILFHGNFKSIKLFTYFKEYSANSALICFVSLGLFLLTTKFINFNSYYSMFYFTHIYLPIVTTGYFYGCILDIVIILEHIFILKNKRNLLGKYKPFRTCAILFVICFIINFPFFLAFRPEIKQVFISPNETFNLYFLASTDFGNSVGGKIVLFAVYILRDLITLLLEATLNIITIVLFKKYILNKSKLLNRTKQPKAVISGSINKGDQKAVSIVIILSILTILEHSAIIMASIYSNFFVNKLTFTFAAFSSFFVTLKHLSNFFLLLIMNKNFKKSFIELFKINCQSNSE